MFSCEDNSVEPLVCGEGTTEVNGECIIQCDQESNFINGNCQCKDDYTYIDGKCYYNNDINFLTELILSNSINIDSNNLEKILDMGNQKWTNGRVFDLDVSFYNIVEIPESIEDLDSLEVLKLYNNQISIIPETMWGLNKLKQLWLQNNNLEVLSENIGNLNKLIHLHLSHNQLSTIPVNISYLSDLRYLSIDNNNLYSLPESINNLSDLYFFDVSRNQLCQEYNFTSITNFNNQVCSTINCESGFSDNTFCYNHEDISIIEEIFYLNNIHNEFVSFNIIKSQEWFEGRLIGLHLYDNQLTSIPESIGGLVNLKEFSLSNNQLTSIPESIGLLINLEELNFSNNYLSSLPNNFELLVNLERLILSNNQLSSLPEYIGDYNNLFWLDVSNNSITQLPDSFCELRFSIILNFIYNDINSNNLCPPYLECFDSFISVIEENNDTSECGD